MSQNSNFNTKKSIIHDGVFKAEVYSILKRSLVDCGFKSIEIRKTPLSTDIKIHVAKVKQVIGKDGQQIRELQNLIQQRFGFPQDKIQIKVQAVQRQGLSSVIMAEQMKYKLVNNIPVRLAASSIMQQIMKDGALGVELKISGKLKQQRAKTVKYKAGYVISTGQPNKDFVDYAVEHVFFKQGIVGVQVKIMLKDCLTGENKTIPDQVVFKQIKNNEIKEIRDNKKSQN